MRFGFIVLVGFVFLLKVITAHECKLGGDDWSLPPFPRR